MADEAALAEFEEDAAENLPVDARIAAGRMFALRDSVWTDLSHHDSLPVVEVEVYSATYFALLRALPELEQWFKAFDSVLVAGAKTSIKTVSTSTPAIRGPALQRLVQEFRGR